MRAGRASGGSTRSGAACDFWRHPEDALDRAAAIGCNAFRLSVEWARLEPDAGRVRRGGARALRRDPLPVRRTGPGAHGHAAPLHPPVVAGRGVLAATRLAGRVRPPRRARSAGAGALLPSLGDDQRAQHRDAHGLDRGCVPAGAPHGGLRRLLRPRQPPHRARAGRRRRAAVQPEAEVTINTSSSSVYEHDRMLLDLLELRDAGVDPRDVDRYVDERRADPRRRASPRTRRRGGDAPVLRRGVALRRRVRPLGRGAAWAPPARPGTATGAAPCRRQPCTTAPRRRALDAVGFDWYDPVASHAIRVPGRRAPEGGRDWSFGRALWDVEPHPSAPAVMVRHRGRAAARASAVDRRERDGDPGA